MEIGIVGLPNVGKSTLFNAVTRAGAAAENFPFCTIEPNVGVAPLEDPRFPPLVDLFKPAKVTKAPVRFVDIAGLVRGAAEGEGLGNKFLAHIREVDAVAQVVRTFDDPDVVHVDGSVDPLRDIETVAVELALADLETVRKGLERRRRQAKADPKLGEGVAHLETLETHLSAGKPARTLAAPETLRDLRRELHLLTAKPVLYAANVAEADLPSGGPAVETIRKRAAAEGAEVVVVSAKVEAEVVELDETERGAYLASLGLAETGLDRLVRDGGPGLAVPGGLDRARVRRADSHRLRARFRPRRGRRLRRPPRRRLVERGQRKGEPSNRGTRIRHEGRRRRPLPRRAVG